MQKINKIQLLRIKITIWLFLLSVSFCAIPSSALLLHGLFGELQTVNVQEETSIHPIAVPIEKKDTNEVQLRTYADWPQIQGVFPSSVTSYLSFFYLSDYAGLLQALMVLFVLSSTVFVKLPVNGSLVTLKVRLND